MDNVFLEISNDGTLVGAYLMHYMGLIIPDKVKRLGDKCFKGCVKLTSIFIPDSVKEIGREAFWGCASLKSIVIPNSVQTIQDNAFHDCSSLTNIVIPDSVKEIGREAFWGCASLKSIVIPNSVQTIQEMAFWGCASLKSIVIPNSVQTIQEMAFDGCSSLTDIVIPDSVKEIGSYAFHGCTSLKSIVIPNSVQSIQEKAFDDCSSLTDIVIPDSVKEIGREAFGGCSELGSITVDKDNKKYDSRDNCNAIIETESNTLILGCASTVIPNSVTGIGNCAFDGCSNLTRLVIPDSVEDIGDCAFYGCTSLHVSIPENWPSEVDGEYYEGYFGRFTGCKSVSRYLSLNDKKEYQSFVTPEELENGIDDEYKVRYSKDGKRLLSYQDPYREYNVCLDCDEACSYRIRKGTEIICEDAGLWYSGELETVHIPASTIYIGRYAFDCNILILEGINTFFCNKFWRPVSTSILYVPNNSKLNYISRLGERIDKSYISADKPLRIVELSKSNVINYLECQKKLITDIIANPEPMKEYTIDSLDGRGPLNFVCIRTDKVCVFGRKESFKPYFLVALHVLGMPLKESCLKVGINVEQLQVNQSTKNSLVGRTLVQPVDRAWEEDFVDEDTGDVVQIQRKDRIVDHKYLEETDLDNLIEYNISSVLVHGKDTPPEDMLWQPPYFHYLDKYYEEYVLKHFLIVDVDESERLTLANELTDIYKAFVGAIDCVDGVNSIQQPHDEVTPEEKRLIDHVSEFYEMKISAIMKCEIDLDMMPLFTTVRETYHELIAFLEENKISDRISIPYVTQLFEQLRESESVFMSRL